MYCSVRISGILKEEIKSGAKSLDKLLELWLVDIQFLTLI